MKQVWKCDHCCKISVSYDKIKEHEPICSYNPINKKCYSCEHRYNYYDSELCAVNLDVCKGEDEGNCIGWETDDPNELRKLKIQKLCKNLLKS